MKKIICICLMALFSSKNALSYELSPPYKMLAERWTESSIGDANQVIDDNLQAKINSVQKSASSHWKALDVSATRSSLWSDLPLDEINGRDTLGVNIRASMLRLYGMGRAFRLPGNLHGDQVLLNDIISSLDFLTSRYYKVDASEYGNWWDWEIGIPKTLNDLVTLIYPYVSHSQLTQYTAASRYFSPLPDRNGVSPGAGASSNPVNREATGGNRTDMVQIVLLRGLISEREDEIKNALAALPQVLETVTSNDGFYSDGSFIQHKDIPYTGTYGNVLLEGGWESNGVNGQFSMACG
ncbi:hypothetical protein [Aeromonas hydrophila]|uniref:hypothetical protein n=1 Tax=Aeromonas hydrophila TaxID=644 RepID=UPI002443138E|nr:hypothetical protein [Aeromonas hydrophila]